MNCITTPDQVIDVHMLQEAAQIISEHKPASHKEARPVLHPCADAWERKWLGLDCWKPEVQRMATEVRRFSARWFANKPDGRLLVLAGHTGCGKTHSLKAVHSFARACGVEPFSKGLWPHPPTVVADLWPETAQALTEGHSANALLRDLIEADLLLLDDIGAESDRFKSGQAVDALCQLLSRRQEKKWTLITTNFAETEWHHKFDLRVADRLHRNSVIVDMSETGSFALL